MTTQSPATRKQSGQPLPSPPQAPNPVSTVHPALRNEVELTLRTLVAETGIDSSLVIRLARELREARTQNRALKEAQTQQAIPASQHAQSLSDVKQLKAQHEYALRTNLQLHNTLLAVHKQYTQVFSQLELCRNQLAARDGAGSPKIQRDQEPEDTQKKIQTLEAELLRSRNAEASTAQHCDMLRLTNTALQNQLTLFTSQQHDPESVPAKRPHSQPPPQSPPHEQPQQSSGNVRLVEHGRRVASAPQMQHQRQHPHAQTQAQAQCSLQQLYTDVVQHRYQQHPQHQQNQRTWCPQGVEAPQLPQQQQHQYVHPHIPYMQQNAQQQQSCPCCPPKRTPRINTTHNGVVPTNMGRYGTSPPVIGTLSPVAWSTISPLNTRRSVSSVQSPLSAVSFPSPVAQVQDVPRSTSVTASESRLTDIVVPQDTPAANTTVRPQQSSKETADIIDLTDDGPESGPPQKRQKTDDLEILPQPPSLEPRGGLVEAEFEQMNETRVQESSPPVDFQQGGTAPQPQPQQQNAEEQPQDGEARPYDMDAQQQYSTQVSQQVVEAAPVEQQHEMMMMPVDAQSAPQAGAAPLDHPEIVEFLAYAFLSAGDDALQKMCTFCRMRHEEDPEGWPTLTILDDPDRDKMVGHLQETHVEVWNAVLQGLGEPEGVLGRSL